MTLLAVKSRAGPRISHLPLSGCDQPVSRKSSNAACSAHTGFSASAPGPRAKASVLLLSSSGTPATRAWCNASRTSP